MKRIFTAVFGLACTAAVLQVTNEQAHAASKHYQLNNPDSASLLRDSASVFSDSSFRMKDSLRFSTPDSASGIADTTGAFQADTASFHRQDTASLSR
jgi:hypothetical protein